MKARLNQHDVDYRIEGPAGPGAAEVLLATDTDLTAGATWATAGYTVAPWLTPAENATLREGLAETLTVQRLGVPPTLARTLRSTNAIESMNSIARTHSRNVKHWTSGNMALRWCAAGMAEAGKQFRRVNGHLHIPALRAALERHVAEHNVSPARQDDNVNAA